MVLLLERLKESIIEDKKSDVSCKAIKNQLESTFLTLHSAFSNRRIEYYEKFNAAFIYTTDAMTKYFLDLDFKFETILREEREYTLVELSSIEENELREFVISVADFDKNWSLAITNSDQLLQFNYILKLKEKLKSFQIAALEIEKKLKKAKNNLAKIARKKQKLLKNLTAFSKWLELMTCEFNKTLFNVDLDHLEKQNKLIELKENCQYHFKFVLKLESFLFDDENQKDIAKENCERYKLLMKHFDELNLPQVKLVSINVESRSSASAFNSAMPSISPWPSVTSPYRPLSCTFSVASSSTFSENTTDTEDLDKDLALIQSEITRTETCRSASQAAYRPTSMMEYIDAKKEQNWNKTYSEILFAVSNNSDISLEVLETTVSSIVNEFEDFYKTYHPCIPLRSLSNACTDLSWLKSKIKELSRCRSDVKQLFKYKSNDKIKKHFYKILTNMKLSKSVSKSFYKSLSNEIDDETSLRINYEQVINHLNCLETEVREASKSERIPNTKDCVSKIELGIDLLKKQCRFSRNYVEISIDGTGNTSPTRKNKIILRITNTVTTIINVIEEELQKQKNSSVSSTNDLYYESEAEFTQLHKKLLNLNKQTKHDLSKEPLTLFIPALTEELDSSSDKIQKIISTLTPIQLSKLTKIHNITKKVAEFISSLAALLCTITDTEFAIQKLNVSDLCN